MSLTLGVDVGGTKILAGVVDDDGRILEQVRVTSPATDAGAITAAIVGLVKDLTGRHQIEAVGVGAAGYIDRGRSTVMFAPNIAWRDVNLRTPIEEASGLPVVIENDANAAAWGEFAFGAAAEVESSLMVTVGTGVGGGIVLDGALQRGAFGVAAEIGHLRVVPGGLICGCGNHGCLESYASGSALVRYARDAADAGHAPGLLERAGGSVKAITGPLVTEAAQAGDEAAIAAFAELGRWLGEGIASLVAVLDPDVIVLGGGVSEAGDLLLEPTRAAFRSQLTGRGHRPEAELRLATLGNEAGLIGAADLARHR
ncbi:ROK family glucokinase [Nocardioides sp. Kera G14]|uniref:ROK family glucokinase n=1 Tax=Nocardioides sp. Kera G14 TaxID=2884264 RepID=UPI001D11A21F|nr:ROK family glucokinase [Nocardioides sp. Kera G14]UDY22518.1 ROK family glucokinase [Nocardioides sp. Kera G14]